MTFKIYSIAITLQIVGMLPATAFDVPPDGLEREARAIFGVTLSDLLVGDKMRVERNFLCTDDGKLMVLGHSYPVERKTYAPELIVEVIPGEQVLLTISTEHMSKPDKSDTYLFLSPCDTWLPTAERLPVQSVNGLTTLDAYLSSDFVTKLPDPEL